jgi:hypothetical protein
VITFMMIGPRQMAGWSRSMRKPMLITFTPKASSGWIFSSRTGRRLVDAEHQREVGPVDVRVHDPDAQPALGEAHGQVHRDRALPHPALAARHGDDAPEPG